MKTYTIFFEFFGRKMKTKVDAESEAAAKEAIRKKITFHVVRPTTAEEIIKDSYRDIMDILNSK